MVPGAKAAGIVPFVDSQIVVAPDDSLLTARYFGIEPPYGDFYRRVCEPSTSWRRARPAHALQRFR
jgi:hypothetical protein